MRWWLSDAAACTHQEGLRDADQGRGPARREPPRRTAPRSSGVGELEARLRAQADELGLGGRVVFAGFRDDLDRLLLGLLPPLPARSRQGGSAPASWTRAAPRRPRTRHGGGRHPGGGVRRREPAAWSRRAIRTRWPPRWWACWRTPGGAGRWARRGRRRFPQQFTVDRMVDATRHPHRDLHEARAGRPQPTGPASPHCGPWPRWSAARNDLFSRTSPRGPRRAAGRVRPGRGHGVKPASSMGGDGTANQVGVGLPACGDRPRARAHGLGQRPGQGPPASPSSPTTRCACWPRPWSAKWTWRTANGRPFLNVSGSGFDAQDRRRLPRATWAERGASPRPNGTSRGDRNNDDALFSAHGGSRVVVQDLAGERVASGRGRRDRGVGVRSKLTPVQLVTRTRRTAPALRPTTPRVPASRPACAPNAAPKSCCRYRSVRTTSGARKPETEAHECESSLDPRPSPRSTFLEPHASSNARRPAASRSARRRRPRQRRSRTADPR